MAINKTTLKNQLTNIVSDGKIAIFSPIEIDKVMCDRLLIDDNEVCVASMDNSWVFPLDELTINELKKVKSAIKETIIEDHLKN